MIYTVFCLLLLGPSLTVYICEGCGRVPATPAPTLSPAPTEPTINGSVRSYECTEAESNKTACLNGGSCFIYIIQNERVANCHCTMYYRGRRCEEYTIEILFPSTSGGHVATAGIAVGVSVLVIFAVIIIIAIYWRRRKAKMRQPVKDYRANGELLPQNHTPPRNSSIMHYRNGNHTDLEKNLLTNPVREYKNTPV